MIAYLSTWATEDAEFDPTIVSPGVEGFIFTGLFALAVIVLGIILVRRMRRNAYRHEARERIAEELAGQGGAEAAEDGEGSAGADRASADEPGAGEAGAGEVGPGEVGPNGTDTEPRG